MSIASKYNKGSAFTYQAPEDVPFISLEKLFHTGGEGVVYPLHSLYINNKSKYGDAPVAITDGYFVNLPRHMLDTVREMMGDMELIAAVNGGHVGFTVRPYVRTGDNKPLYSVTWLDI